MINNGVFHFYTNDSSNKYLNGHWTMAKFQRTTQAADLGMYTN